MKGQVDITTGKKLHPAGRKKKVVKKVVEEKPKEKKVEEKLKEEVEENKVALKPSYRVSKLNIK